MIMRTETLPLGVYQANCYLVCDNNQYLIIDPGSKPELIISRISQQATVVAVLLTHGHFDHFAAAQTIAGHYNCDIYVHAEDEELLADPMKNYSEHRNITCTKHIKSFDLSYLSLGPFKINVFHTPGHSEGSVCYMIDHHLYCGDLIFKNSIGRTDLYRGNMKKMMESLRYICSLDGHIEVYPGHGPKTTLAAEKAFNPYLIPLSKNFR